MVRSYWYLLGVLLLCAGPATAKVRLPSIFGDHMVLQQRTKAAFWGWADPGEAVTITPGWQGISVQVRADASGRWSAQLPTPAAGGPYRLRINDISIEDVLIGEVWLCSGQSNMVFSLKSSANATTAIADANRPSIRYFSATRQYARHDFDNSPGAAWVLCSPKTAPGFSAVAYFFARKIQETLKVPVGIVYSAWGGTPAEAWTPEPVLTADTILTRYQQRWKYIQENAGADSVKYHAELAAGHKVAEPQTLYYFDRPWREPGVLYNGMIRPLIPYTIKGVLWYQGESNVNYADEYYRLLSAMIGSWRQQWKRPDLPFYIVQIAAYGYNSLNNAARLRQAEYEISRHVPHTATAVTLDLGDMKNIHYTHKQEVGDRLARIALARDYGFTHLVWQGPVFASVREKGDTLVIQFDPPAGKLVAGKPGEASCSEPGGFELGYTAPSGDSLVYTPAQSKIQGDQVLVWKPGLTHPRAVRYGWGLPAQADLYDTAGLPAFPFEARIDENSHGAAATRSTADETNLALGKPVIANSAAPGYPASNVVDGRTTRNSKWQSANITPPHILEINLQRYCDISKIVIHTGIPESERTPAESSRAAGFWSAKNFKLQYWDDANWTDIPNTEVHENRLTDVPFALSPAINTFKLRFVCDDGEPISIMEIEVFGKTTGNTPVAGSGAPDLTPRTERTAGRRLTLKISDSIIGKTMRYVGYNQGYYMPGGNTSGWLEYAGVNSLRVWTTLNSYVPASAVQVDNTVTTVDEFDRRKSSLRANPEKNKFIQWDQLLPLYEYPEKGANTNPMVLSYCLSELKRLHIDPIIQVGSTDFDSTWSNKWKQWQRYYALAFYCAKTGDVTMYAMQNEPNHRNSGPMKLDQWIGGMQIVSDALTCAIEDVDRLYGKHLEARMVGPVTAGNNPEWWTAVAKAQRTDYHGRAIDHDLLGIFSTHSYNSPAAGYVHRVADIRKLLEANQPGGKALPIVYTEIGRWMNAYLIDKEETMDDPSLFTEWAGIYANNTLNGAYGMWAFKFANTVSTNYPMGIKSGHHFSWPGHRIVEDAYTDLALNRPVTASAASTQWPASNVADGDKSDRSAWHSDSSTGPKWLEIDLGKEQELGSGVVYTGGAHGDYTSPSRVRDFSLQYETANGWKDIPGFSLHNNKYSQVFLVFKSPVITRRIRFLSNDPGVIEVREIKVFAKNDGPSDVPDYDVSGIQRTGEVVHLFAKGFKDEHPLLATHAGVSDDKLHTLASYDPASGNYYCWLVQSGGYTDHITLDLGALPVHAGTPVTAESVGPTSYGEVTAIYPLPADKKLSIPLGGQTVLLLTIPSGTQKRTVLAAAAVAAVSPKGPLNTLQIALDASKPEKNKVSYIRFDLSPTRTASASRILLKVHGSNVTDTAIYRFHVYGLPAGEWKHLTWHTAPQLDAKEALIHEVGRKAFVAGELAMSHTPKDHWLDVTALIKTHAGSSITFALIRETRHTGDDADKSRTVEIDERPELIYWTGKTTVHGTTYYINSRHGDDAGSGTSRDHAWQSLAPLEQHVFNPGDSILFAKGSAYTGGFVFHSSGTADHPIVFSNYSAGADIVRSTPRDKLGDCFIRYGAGPLPAFTNPDWNVLNGNIFRVRGNYIVIDGLYFHDNTNPPGSDRHNKNVQKMGAVYFSLGTHHNVIRNCEFFHTPVAIKIKGSYNVVTHNYLHDATDTLAHSWGPIAIMVVRPHNEISFNRIVNYGSYGGPYGADGGAVELDGVDDDFQGSNVDIHHNISINNHGFLELAGKHVDSITVAYNVSDDINQFVGGGSMNHIVVRNNTVIRLREPNVDRYVFWTFSPDSCHLVVSHNIFVLPPDIRVYGPRVKVSGHVRSMVGDQPHDHNLYYAAGDTDPLGIAPGKGDTIADPRFIDYPHNDYRLSAASPAKGKNIGAL